MIFSLQINRWLPYYILSYSDVIAQQSQTNISFATAHYRFPNYIILKNVKIFDPYKKTPLLQASKIVMKFSIARQDLNCLIIKEADIDFKILKNYWLRHGKEIRLRAKASRQGTLRLVISRGLLHLNAAHESPIPFQIDLNLNQGHLGAQGYWGNKNKVTYEVKGDLHDSGFDLNKFTLKNDGSSINLWGSWYANNINWRGFIFYDKFYILDINGNLKIQQKDIILKRLSFSINGNEIKASGHCLRQSDFQCAADINYIRAAPNVTSKDNLENITLQLQAQNNSQGLLFKGAADLNFLLNADSKKYLKNVHIDFSDLNMSFLNSSSLKLKIKQMQGTLSTPGNTYAIPMENVWASFNFTDPFQKLVTVSGTLFAGHYYSQIFLDTSSLPYQIHAQGSLEQVDIDQLGHAFYPHEQYHGILAGTFDVHSSKSRDLSGSLVINHGDFNGTHIQQWIAKTLQMHSLISVSNANLYCRFKINEMSKRLENLNLSTDDLELSGFFNLDEDDLVSSQASVRFSKKLLRESPVGRDIIGLVHGAWTLPFEFSLSGNMNRMNFQWNNSLLKDKVRQHLFSFLERMIDRRMDAYPIYKVTIPNESVTPG